MSSEKGPAVIVFACEINQVTVGKLVHWSTEYCRNGHSELHIHIASPGGHIQWAFAAYNHLRSLNTPLVTCNIGHVESCAVIIYLAGAIRRAAAHTTFLMHDFAWDIPAGITRRIVIQELCDSINSDAKRYAEIFQERTGHDFSVVDAIDRKPLRVNETEAFSHGLLTHPATTGAYVIPDNATVRAITAY